MLITVASVSSQNDLDQRCSFFARHAPVAGRALGVYNESV